MENYRADKLDPICRKNFIAGSHPDSFRYIPRYLTECLSQLTFIQQIPIFTFPNKLEVLLKAEQMNEYFCWAVSVSFGDYSFEKFPDYDCSRFNKDCHTLDELLAALYFIPEDVADSWIKALKNNRRKNWKTDEEIFASDKFQKVFVPALQKGIIENRKTYPFLVPEVQDKIEYKRITNMDYTIIYKCGVCVSSKKWGNGYTITDKNNPQAKPLILDGIDIVNDFIKNRIGSKTVENDEDAEKSLGKADEDAKKSLEKVVSNIDKQDGKDAETFETKEKFHVEEPIVKNDEETVKPKLEKKVRVKRVKAEKRVEEETVKETKPAVKSTKEAKEPKATEVIKELKAEKVSKEPKPTVKPKKAIKPNDKEKQELQKVPAKAKEEIKKAFNRTKTVENVPQSKETKAKRTVVSDTKKPEKKTDGKAKSRTQEATLPIEKAKETKVKIKSKTEQKTEPKVEPKTQTIKLKTKETDVKESKTVVPKSDKPKEQNAKTMKGQKALAEEQTKETKESKSTDKQTKTDKSVYKIKEKTKTKSKK